MKKGMAVLVFIPACYFGHAQVSPPATAVDTSKSAKTVKPEKRDHHYLSVNTTFFIKQFLTFTSSGISITASPYIFEYKFLRGNQGFRLGMGGNLTNQKKTDDQNNVSISKNSSFDMRFGYIYQAQISKHWAYFVGVDAIFNRSKALRTDNTSNDAVTSDTTGLGGGFGPSFGIQLNINKRIGVFTESAIYYTNVTENGKTSSSNFPELSTSDKTVTNKIQFIIPTSIYFFVRF